MRAALVALACAGVACSFEKGTLGVIDAPAGDGSGVIDAPRIDATADVMFDARICPAAPNGCTAFTCSTSSSCYYTCGQTGVTKASWSGGETSCENAGLGCLVTINDQAEQNCITAATVPTFTNQQTVWIGFYQTSKANEPAGNWAWKCGSSSYLISTWGMFEPTNTNNNEDCAALTDGGGWFDANCGGTSRYVCEL